MTALKREKLIWNAVPTLFDVPNPPTPVTPVRTDPQKRKDAFVEPSSTARKRKKGLLFLPGYKDNAFNYLGVSSGLHTSAFSVKRSYL